MTWSPLHAHGWEWFASALNSVCMGVQRLQHDLGGSRYICCCTTHACAHVTHILTSSFLFCSRPHHQRESQGLHVAPGAAPEALLPRCGCRPGLARVLPSAAQHPHARGSGGAQLVFRLALADLSLGLSATAFCLPGFWWGLVTQVP